MAYNMEHETYYEVLDIRRNATDIDIERAFKQLSLRYHPMRNPTNMATNTHKFNQVCEAYDVLSNHDTKAIYDAYGEYALKEGIVTADGTKIGGGYFMKLEAQNFFEKQFCGADILKDTRAIDGTDIRPSFFADSLGGQGVAEKEAPENIDITLDCTLEEFYNGCIKQVEFERLVVKFDAKTITLTEAIEMNPISFCTLDGRKLTVTIDEQISPQTCKAIAGEGMPITQSDEFKQDLFNHTLAKSQLPRGSLYLRFDIQFPTQFKLDVKKTLIDCLKKNKEACGL